MAAISVDPPAASAELARAQRLTLRLLADPARQVIRRYGVEDAENGIAWPALFVVAPGGKVAWRALSRTYPERPTVAQVLAALDGIAGAAPAEALPRTTGAVVPSSRR